jgi:hypothetical protein
VNPAMPIAPGGGCTERKLARLDRRRTNERSPSVAPSRSLSVSRLIRGCECTALRVGRRPLGNCERLMDFGNRPACECCSKCVFRFNGRSLIGNYSTRDSKSAPCLCARQDRKQRAARSTRCASLSAPAESSRKGVSKGLPRPEATTSAGLSVRGRGPSGRI